jgi:hypothetical protein
VECDRAWCVIDEMKGATRDPGDAAARVRDTLRQLAVQATSALERWEAVSELAVAEIGKLKRSSERESHACVRTCARRAVFKKSQHSRPTSGLHNCILVAS